MTEILVSNAAQLSAAITAARGGDIIRLAAGDYGDVSIRKTSTTDIIITSADPGQPASFNSITVRSSSGLVFDGVDVDLKPTATMTATSTALLISRSTDVTFKNGVIKSGPSINGVSPGATTLDATGNVLGLPAGRGVVVELSSFVTLEGNELFDVNTGIALSTSSDLIVRGNDIHDVRTTPIRGGGLNRVLIEDNHMTEARPWRWGAGGDHADFIHLWTRPDIQTGPSTDIRIVNNVMEQGEGTAILGIYIDDDNTGFGFSRVTIDNNLILNGNGQAIRLENVFDSSVTNNTLLQTSGTTKDTPVIRLHDGSHNVLVSGNVAGAVQDVTGLSNTLRDNLIVQRFDATKAGYYTDTLIDTVDDLSPAAAYDAVLSQFSAPAVTTTITGTAAADTLVGTAAADTLVGLAGNDNLNGGAGADRMEGGAGSDTYHVDHAGDVVVETLAGSAGGTADKVFASVDHTLAANVERLTLSGSAAIDGTGNSLGNLIYGNGAANELDGMAGNDTLTSGSGNDTLDGGAGVDVLIGGAGADRFVFAKGQAAGDRINDFTGDDLIQLTGYSAGSTITKVAGSTTDWLIKDQATGATEVIKLANGYSLTAGDFLFG